MSSPRRHLLLVPALAVTLGLGLTACGGDESEPESTVAADAPYNDADLAFATEMIPHHADAGLMVDLTMGRRLDPELMALAEEIRAEQSVEVEAMVDWLTEWDQPVPETMRDHANAHAAEGEGDDHGASDLEELESLPDAEFEDRWLELMIEHHEGAIEMAETEAADGEYADAVAMAEDIQESQQAQIDRMEQLLAQ